MEDLRKEFCETKEQLKTEGKLSKAIAKLGKTEAKLNEAIADLQESETNLSATKDELSETKAELEESLGKIKGYECELFKVHDNQRKMLQQLRKLDDCEKDRRSEFDRRFQDAYESTETHIDGIADYARPIEG